MNERERASSLSFLAEDVTMQYSQSGIARWPALHNELTEISCL